MDYTYTPYIWPYIGTVLLNLLMIVYIVKSRWMNGAIAFIFTLFFSTLWCVGTAMELSAGSLAAKLFWARIGFPAYALGPMAWMIMVLQITDRGQWIRQKSRILLLFILPFITILLVWTNDFHNLIWKDAFIDTSSAVHPLIRNFGAWFWVHAFYSDSVNLLSVILIAWFWRKKAPSYGKQFRCLLYSMAFVMLVNAFYTLGIWPRYDITPVAWGLSSLLILWALFRHKLFDLVPIAQSRVMESLTDGIVVLDTKDRMVDMNPSAKRVFRCEAASNIGRNAFDLFEGWPVLQQVVMEGKEITEFTQGQDGKLQYYETSYLPIRNERGILLGKLLTVRNVTEKKMTEWALLQKQQEIAIKEERERVARDLHDNLGQVLGFVNVQSQAIREYLKNGRMEPSMQCLERLTEVAQQAHNAIRETILSMREEGVDAGKQETDFLEELNRQASMIEKSYGIPVETDYAGAEGFDLREPVVKAQVLNIIREALNNIVKHSGASAASILFEEKPDGLCICIHDNGCGFETGNPASKHGNHYGLLFMKERAKEAGVHLNVYSGPGKGTTVEIRIPGRLCKEGSRINASI